MGFNRSNVEVLFPIEGVFLTIVVLFTIDEVFLIIKVSFNLDNYSLVLLSIVGRFQ